MIRWIALAAAGAGVTGCGRHRRAQAHSESNRKFACTTTDSPASRPDRISARSPCAPPTVTARGLGRRFARLRSTELADAGVQRSRASGTTSLGPRLQLDVRVHAGLEPLAGIVELNRTRSVRVSVSNGTIDGTDARRTPCPARRRA